jgi:Superfamily II DNA/RNA helicases, SNF2 family
VEPRLTLRPVQEINCQQIMREPATLLAGRLGSGKTTVAVEAVFRTQSINKSVFVVAPRNTEQGWRKSVRRQYQQDDFFNRIDSTKSGKQAMADLWSGVDGWYFITWEYFRARPVHFWAKLNVDVVIADEVHRMQNRNSKTWTHMRGLGKKSKRIAMSGTPQGNNMQGLWTTLRWLFPENENDGLYTTPLSFWRWVADWLLVEEDEWLGFVSVLGEKYEPGTMLSYYRSYIRETDHNEVPPVNDIEIFVSMNAEQKRLYKQVQEESIAWLNTPDPMTGKKPMVSELPMTTRIRLRQITLGVPIINDNNKVSYAVDTISSKIDAALEELADLPEGEPVLVFTHSREFALVAAKRFCNAGYPAFAWVGGTSDKVRQSVLAGWGTQGGNQVVVAVISAIAEGTDGLQYKCAEEIWLSEDESRIINEQARGRLPRDGQKRVVNRRMIIVPGTYDQKIIDKHLAAMLESNKSLRGK